MAVALEERRSVIRVWRDNFAPLWLSFLVGLLCGGLLAVFLRELNLPFLLLMAPLPIVLYPRSGSGWPGWTIASHHLAGAEQSGAGVE